MTLPNRRAFLKAITRTGVGAAAVAVLGLPKTRPAEAAEQTFTVRVHVGSTEIATTVDRAVSDATALQQGFVSTNEVRVLTDLPPRRDAHCMECGDPVWRMGDVGSLKPVLLCISCYPGDGYYSANRGDRGSTPSFAAQLVEIGVEPTPELLDQMARRRR